MAGWGDKGRHTVSTEYEAGVGFRQLRPLTILGRWAVKVQAFIHSLKDKEHDRHVLGEAEIIKQIGDNLYLAEVNGVKCTAILNPFVNRYFVDDVFGIIQNDPVPVIDEP